MMMNAPTRCSSSSTSVTFIAGRLGAPPAMRGLMSRMDMPGTGPARICDSEG